MHVLNSLPANAIALIQSFQQIVDVRAQLIGVGIASLHMLQQQLQVYEDCFKDLAITSREKISARQREINREFVPIIEAAMENAYSTCVAERGSGSFMRMKAVMTGHIDLARNSMFKASTNQVRKQLDKMLRGIEEELNNRTDEVFAAMRRDYRSILGGEDVPQGEMMPKWAKEMRREITKLIDGMEEYFTRIKESDAGHIKDDKQIQEIDSAPDSGELKSDVPDAIASANIDSYACKLDTTIDNSDAIVDKSDATTASALDPASESNMANNLDHLKQNDKHETSIPLPEDTEMANFQLTTIKQEEVEDPEANSTRPSTPIKKEFSVERENASQVEIDSRRTETVSDHITDREKDLSANTIPPFQW